jgi:cobalamin biosynthesis Mg chelatase CobN
VNRKLAIAFALVLSAGPAFAVVKTAPVRMQSAPLGSVSAAAGVHVLGARAFAPAGTDLKTFDAPAVSRFAGVSASVASAPGEAEAVRPAETAAVAAKTALTSLGSAVATSKKEGAQPGAKIAAAYDGGSEKKGVSPSAVFADIGADAVGRPSGLLKHSSEKGSDTEFKPASVEDAPKARQEREDDPWTARGFFSELAVVLIGLAAVVALYGGIYWAIVNKASHYVPTDQQIIEQMYGKELREFGW